MSDDKSLKERVVCQLSLHCFTIRSLSHFNLVFLLTNEHFQIFSQPKNVKFWHNFILAKKVNACKKTKIFIHCNSHFEIIH